jgi:GNAT superfamily N-acetyltransferase
MSQLAASATSVDGDVGPDGANMYRVWGSSSGLEVTSRNGDDDKGSTDRALFVAERGDGQVLGLCCVKRGEGEHDSPSVECPVFSIWRMSVHESARGAKVGARLMSAAEEWARLRGGRKMTLVTGNSIASLFYKRIGYQTVNFWGIRHEKDLVVKSPTY